MKANYRINRFTSIYWGQADSDCIQLEETIYGGAIVKYRKVEGKFIVYCKKDKAEKWLCNDPFEALSFIKSIYPELSSKTLDEFFDECAKV